MFQERYKIIKAFNHNVIFCTSMIYKKECILIGTGIGFGVKSGEVIKESTKIEKIFFLKEKGNLKRFNDLTEVVENNIVGVTEEVIALISTIIPDKLNENLHITLLDHINFSIKRYNAKIEIKNPFLYQIKLLYKEEYLAAERALKVINEKLKIELPEDEIGMITMHIHAAIHNTTVTKASINAEVISEMITFFEEAYQIKLDKDSIHYARLITHLRFAIDRVMKNINIDNLMLEDIKCRYKESYDISYRIAEKINDEYKILFPENEIGYISLHLQNIINEYDKN